MTSEAVVRAAISDEAVRRSLWVAIRALGVRAPEPSIRHDPETGLPSWWPIDLAELAFYVAEQTVAEVSASRAKILTQQGTIRALRRLLSRMPTSPTETDNT